ncbi:granzyme-like protein 2 [Gouania willdenowi]|uniref:trypsin n=1 Tax=Gouania willdenowi TaxID=441366 RepID=A0A8C5E6G8_GOUWI|nr:granzyme-like protein 2 [Gouania willdenowi]
MSICFKLIVTLLILEYMVNAEGIIGGHEAKNHSRPYMVLLELHSGKVIRYCGGFLIKSDFVMTAAHCQAESYKVYLGLQVYPQLEGVQILSVIREFLPKHHHMGKNDIMLLKLSRKATIDKKVKPILLAGQFNHMPSWCLVSGWGRTENSTALSNKLMEVNVMMVNDTLCDEEDMYCSTGWAGPGEGDSGGPLVCQNRKMVWKVYGVVSSNYQLCNSTTLHLYTKIGDKLEWIRKQYENN